MRAIYCGGAVEMARFLFHRKLRPVKEKASGKMRIRFFIRERGFQYTSQAFYSRLKKHHMKQSMSRVAHCIDNGPMEGFWGSLKREMYYGKRFTSKEELIQSIQDYIEYYNNRRLQRKLHIMTPMAFHELTLKAA